ncbi:MAG: hypothetical protein FWH07_07865 [Oscillospiraceae bacterium]|nr:hypothetical protein [Oscillospiraceae bacterium]
MRSNKKSFLQLLLPGLGYVIMGNLLSTIMTISLAMFRMEILIMGLSVVFGMAIYLLLVAVPAYKDGLEENTRAKRETGGERTATQWRWAFVGLILWGVMLIPSIVFLLSDFNEGAYRLINGAVSPLSAFMLTGTGEFVTNQAGDETEILQLASFAPYVFMGFYALTIPACHIGFMLGLRDSFNKDRLLYGKQHDK